MKPLGKEERADATRRIQAYFREERGEEVGDLAAVILLDFIEADLAPAYYNQGVRDAKTLALRLSATLDEELDALQLLAPKGRRAKPPAPRP